MKNTYLIFIVASIASCAHAQQTASVVSTNAAPIKFASEKISRSLVQQGFKVDASLLLGKRKKESKFQVVLATAKDKSLLNSIAKTSITFPDKLEAEGFSIQSILNSGVQTVFIVGHDEAGAMYGGLEVAEVIRLYGIDSIKNVEQNPYMKKRGVKMNIPLDVRTPSYTDMSDASQHNIAEMWSMDFWKEYLDSLATYRFNFVSLWSLHPFPSMIKVPEYPDVALSDVHRSKAKFQEYYSTRATGFDAPEIVNNYEVIKKISIDEKIKFWQEVMRYAKDRNIEFYIVTWNIYTCGTNGKYGITDDFKNATTIDYFRKSIKQLFITYPLLAGIGLTTGENMPGADFQQKEDWSFETYGKGVLDVAKLQPNRKVTLIHRQHEAGALDIVKKFSPLIDNKNINFVFSFKYAQAHVYSATTQVHHHEFAKQIQSKENLKTLWTLRNDDVYYFRWGSPDFVRAFIRNIPMDITEGYYYGSDQYVWGREFLEITKKDNREIEIAKHWYQWMLWGRLGYNPTLTNDRFLGHVHAQYPQADSRKLFDAWQAASMIYPLTTGFHYGALDFQWYIEASKSRPEPAQTATGFHDIQRFITLPPYKATDNISIPDYVKNKLSDTPLPGSTPIDVAEKLNAAADTALKLLKDQSSSGNENLYQTMEDIRAISYLGKYYAHKILAATNLEFFTKKADTLFHQQIIHHLNLSSLYWRYYASTALAHYKNPLWTNRVGHVDWRGIYMETLQEITNRQGQLTVLTMDVTAGGKIVEAEAIVSSNLKAASDVKGFTGSGYVYSTTADPFRFNVEAQRAGKYILEFQYSKNNKSTDQVDVTLDGKNSYRFSFWTTATSQHWVWDRLEVDLEKGNHQISLSLPEGVLLDHVNILTP